MPVIGRLDSQVNDVLIEPLGKRRDRDERDPRTTADDARPATTGEAQRDDAGGVSDKARDDSDDPRDDVRSRDEQLPVWLL
jgi:hypothetical protein